MSDIPQHKEVFENNLEYVTLFKVGEKQNLTEIIRKEITEFSNEVNYGLANYIEKNFSTEVMSRKYQEMYDFIFKRNRYKRRKK